MTKARLRRARENTVAFLRMVISEYDGYMYKLNRTEYERQQ